MQVYNLHSYWNPFIFDLPTKNGGFPYVSLPDGIILYHLGMAKNYE